MRLPEDTRNAMFLARLATLVEIYLDNSICKTEFEQRYKQFERYFEAGTHPYCQDKPYQQPEDVE